MIGASPLRIAVVAPPWYPVPPAGYGGIERVVHLLATGLSRRGHSVTVFGAEGTTTGDDIRARAPEAWSNEMGTWIHKHTYLARVYRELKGERFDVVHDHSGSEGLLAAAVAGLDCSLVATVHEPVGPAETAFLTEVDDAAALVAVSHAQRTGAAGVHWAGTVYNAIDPGDLANGVTPRPAKDAYLVQLARVDASKGQHIAIEVARRVGLPLVLAGKVDNLHECEAYFREHVQPHLGEYVTWIPEVRGKEKAELLAGALAMVFPIQWEEPFGLAMVEAMANGTPVVALARGAARELVEEGITGTVCTDVDGMVAGVAKAAEIDRQRCAAAARARFSPKQMVTAYEDIYATARRRGGQ